MSKKKTQNYGGIVFSTDPDFKLQNVEEDKTEQLNVAQQKLKVRLDSKQRAGKSVTLVNGFQGKENELIELGKQIKSFCGTGGSVKDGIIIIQGDQREKVMLWLTKNGYNNAKKIN